MSPKITPYLALLVSTPLNEKKIVQFTSNRINLSVYACMFVCVYVRVCACMCACMRACMCVRTCVVCARTPERAHVLAHACECVRVLWEASSKSG